MYLNLALDLLYSRFANTVIPHPLPNTSWTESNFAYDTTMPLKPVKITYR